MLELPGARHVPTGEGLERAVTEIKSFLEGVWESEPGDSEPDRVLATVLFTDIIESSERAAELGDRAWRDLLERHHELVRRQLVRYRGREVDTAGDGFLASFDGPARAIRCTNAEGRNSPDHAMTRCGSIGAWRSRLGGLAPGGSSRTTPSGTTANAGTEGNGPVRGAQGKRPSDTSSQPSEGSSGSGETACIAVA